MIIAERDVIIVGAGPAGSICAAYLAKAGVDVLWYKKDNTTLSTPGMDEMLKSKK